MEDFNVLKEVYEYPTSTVIQIESEGVLCGSISEVGHDRFEEDIYDWGNC